MVSQELVLLAERFHDGAITAPSSTLDLSTWRSRSSMDRSLLSELVFCLGQRVGLLLCFSARLQGHVARDGIVLPQRGSRLARRPRQHQAAHVTPDHDLSRDGTWSQKRPAPPTLSLSLA